MKFYTFPPSPNCRKVQITLDVLGLEHDTQIINLLEGDQKDPSYVSVNPNGMVPALVDGETTLWESNAIMAYVAGRTDTNLWPKSDKRYSIMRWLNWEACHWGPAAAGMIGERILKKLTGAGEPDMKVIEASAKDFERFAAVLNGALEGQQYILGDELTLADIALGVYMSYAEPAQFPLANYHEVQRWHAGLCELSAWKKNLPKLG